MPREKWPMSYNKFKPNKETGEVSENSLFSFLWIWPARVLISSLRVWSSLFIPTDKGNVFGTLKSFSLHAEDSSWPPLLTTMFCCWGRSLELLGNMTYRPLGAPHPAQSSACSQGQTPSAWGCSGPHEFLAPGTKIIIFSKLTQVHDLLLASSFSK